MATVNSTVLLAGLQEYHKRLEIHMQQMEQEYQKLEKRWQSFNAVYDGNAAQQFRAGWQRTSSGFHEYINQSKNIMSVLEERIASLREVNRVEGTL